jgi:hypothetical protein
VRLPVIKRIKVRIEMNIIKRLKKMVRWEVSILLMLFAQDCKLFIDACCINSFL